MNTGIEKITPENIKKIFEAKGYTLFENDTKEYNLNIIGIRSTDRTVDIFNDYICLMWKFKGEWNIKVYPATTESGLYYLQNPMNSTGTKILKEGQYKNVYDIGLHQGKYEALKQVDEMIFHLDNNKDNKHDFTSVLYTGIIGANVHHAGEVSKLVGKWSAACQVLQKLKDWKEFIGICKKSKAIFKSLFTYTLINENDFNIQEEEKKNFNNLELPINKNEMKKPIKEVIKNAHMHLLGIESIAIKLIPILVRLINNKKYRKIIVKLLRIANPCSKTDDIERLANFVESMGIPMRQKANDIISQYPEGTIFNVLTIDQTYMGAGKVELKFENQIEEVIELIEEGYPLKLFVHIDARRPSYITMLNKYKDYISGIKMYNLMGYFPYDTRLEPLWQWCKKYNKPVIWHCSLENINYYRGKDIDLLLNRSRFPLYKTKNNNRKKASNFNNPLGILEVARLNPEVNMMLSHFGGKDEIYKYLNGDMNSIAKILIDGAIELENVYLDDSFVCDNLKVYEFIKNLLKTPIIGDKVVYGDDYDMNKSESFQELFYPGLKNYLGPELWNKHANINYDKFMKINSTL